MAGATATAYDAAQWHDLFVAVAGASAALAGLVFVAISINIERILALPGVPERGLETVLLLVLALIASIAGLVPQSNAALGIELLLVTAVVIAVITRLPPVPTRPTGGEPWSSIVTRWVIRVAGTGLFVVGGLSIAVEAGGGLYWVAGATAFAIAGAVANAWVLLVEILR